MKRISIILSFLISSIISFGQNGNWSGVTPLGGTPNNISEPPGALRGKLGIIAGSFVDTIAANQNLKTNSVAGTLIWVTSTNSYWYRNNANTWVQISPQTAQCQSSLIGSATWSGVGLDYDVTNLRYNLPVNYCLFYNTLATTLTDAPADPTFDRIDYIVADINQDVYFVNGTAGSGVPPSINPLTQRIIAQVNVPAGSPTPDPTINIVHLIYDENLPPEWAGSSNVSGVDFAATSPTPCYGTVSTKVPNPTNGQYVEWQNPYGATDISNGQYLKFRIKLSGAPTTGSTLLNIGFYNVATQSTQIFPVANGSYGLDYNSTACQSIVIPIVAPFNSTTADRVIFTFSGASGITVTLDRVYLLEGANPPPSPSGGLKWTIGGDFLNGIRPAWLGSLDKSEISLVTEGKERLSLLADSIPVSTDTADFVLVVPSVGKPYLKKIHQPSIYALGCLKIYDSTSSGITRKYIRDTCSGGGGGAGWELIGNAGTNASTNFIGTTDDIDFVGRRNNIRSLLIGTANTSLGYSSLSSLSSGFGNIGIGSSALASIASEQANIAIGNSALAGSSGNNNTAVGAQAGLFMSTGSNNTLIGYNSVQTANVSGSYNTLIGASTDLAALTTKYAVGIGNRAIPKTYQLAGSDSIRFFKFKGLSLRGSSTLNYVLTDTTGNGDLSLQPAAGGSSPWTQGTGIIYPTTITDVVGIGATPTAGDDNGLLQISKTGGVTGFLVGTDVRLNGTSGVEVDNNFFSTSTAAIAKGIHAVGTGTSSSIYGVEAEATATTSGNAFGVSGVAGANTGDAIAGYFSATATDSTKAYGIYSAAGYNYFNGKVGIGTTIPDSTLTVVGGVSITGDAYVNGNSTVNGLITGTNGINITGSGNNVFMGDDAITTYSIGRSDDTHLNLFGAAGGNIGYFIDDGSNTFKLGINNSAPAEALDVVGNIVASGTITPSDKRYKTNISPINKALLKVLNLKPSTYFYDTASYPNKKFNKGLQYGLIAQETETVLPEVVTTNKQGYKGINYSEIIPVLVGAVQELSAKVDKQAAEIKSLKRKLKTNKK